MDSVEEKPFLRKETGKKANVRTGLKIRSDEAMNLNERLLVQMVVAMYRGGRRKAKTGCAYRFMTAAQPVAFGNLWK